MESIIQLLPDAIANQIAAGEVVQRPASVVKELLENAVDAGAHRIDLFIKDAGKTLIQVTDNGCGMSARDARMAFERHATSKIRNENDLFNIRTLGFRGEALSSIAAVAQVKLRTRLHEEELGVELDISGGQVTLQEPCSMPGGTVFYVKNLFYNVPARRNFLKSNPVETRHILNEFFRVAIPHPEIHMTLRHNTTEVYNLPSGTLEERLTALFGGELKDQLAYVEESSGYVTISGFIGNANLYRKNRHEQFIFVNNRYIRSNYLNHAITQAYKDVIPKDTYPFYTIFLEIDPVHVDINIHPTKTEVKFDDEKTIYILLQSLIKRGLGGVHDTPSFDFTDPKLKDAIYNSKPRKEPISDNLTVGEYRPPRQQPVNPADWDTLYRPEKSNQDLFPEQPVENIERHSAPTLFDGTGNAQTPKEISETASLSESFYVQYEGSYILTEQKQKLYIINQKAAHQRILYEKFLATRTGPKIPSQQLLFPQTFEFPPVDYAALGEAGEILRKIGFEMQEFGKNTFILYGTPAGIPVGQIRDILEQIISDIKTRGMTRAYEKLFEGIARSVAVRSAVTPRQNLSVAEMKNMVADLFQCEAPAYSPTGKPVFRVIEPLELAEYFK